MKKNNDKELKQDKNKKKVDVKKNNDVKVKKGNIFKRIGKYFRGVGTEIKRIRWTDGKDLVKYSVATVIFVVFLGLYFYGIDWIALIVRSLAN